MSRKVPQDIRDQVQAKLWSKANEIGWSSLADADRAVWYGRWVKDESIGGVLAYFVDPRRVRVYLKDSLLKPYQSTRLEEKSGAVLRALDLAVDSLCRKAYDKPQGRMLMDGRVFSWGNSRDWKGIVFATFERAYKSGTTPFGVALLQNGKPTSAGARGMIKTAANRLGIEQVVWLD